MPRFFLPLTLGLVVGLLAGMPLATYPEPLWSFDTQGLLPTFSDSDFESIVADYDGDGIDDALFRPRQGGDLYLVLRDTNGNLTNRHQRISADYGSVNWAAAELVAGDFSGDGRADVVVQNGGGERHGLITTTGGGEFETRPSHAWADDHLGLNWAHQHATLHVGNFNGQDGDGRFRQDLMLQVRDGDRRYMALVRATRKGFSEVVQRWGTEDSELPWFSDWHELVIGDFNHDGRDDVLIRNRIDGSGHLVVSDASGILALNGAQSLPPAAVTQYLRDSRRADGHALPQGLGDAGIPQGHGPAGNQTRGATDLDGTATAGVHAVNQGAAQYSIPIQVSPGRNGLAPTLSLNYSSGVGDGYLGVGWSLGGMSEIERCVAPVNAGGPMKAVTFDTDDRLCLDGARLLGVTGAYGAANSTYRTEIDRFARITSIGSAGPGPRSFKVEAKSGLVHRYGENNTSRIEAQGRADGAIITWAIHDTTDPFGNVVRYSWHEDTAAGEHYLESIQWVTDAAGANALRRVEFAYEPRSLHSQDSDKLVSYVGGSRREASQLLRTISVDYRDTQGASWIAAREYTLNYLPGPTNGRPRLDSVGECGRPTDATGPDVLECLPATEFEWVDAAITPALSEEFLGVAGIDVPGPSYYVPRVAGPGDLNGDGLLDLVAPRPSGIQVWLGSTSSAYVDGSEWSAGGVVTAAELDTANPVIDWNRDGRTDFILNEPSDCGSTDMPDPPLSVDTDPPGQTSFFHVSWTPAPTGCRPSTYTVRVCHILSGTCETHAGVGAPPLTINTCGGSYEQGTYRSEVKACGTLCSEWTVETGKFLVLPCAGGEPESQHANFFPESVAELKVLHFGGAGGQSPTVQPLGIMANPPLAGYQPGTPYVRQYHVGDFDGDGDEDIVARWENEWQLHLANGLIFDDSQTTPASATGHARSQLIEFNGDGLPDLLVEFNSRYIVLQGSGAGLTEVANVELPQVPEREVDTGQQSYFEPPMAPIMADFNGDGLTDALIPWDNDMELRFGTGTQWSTGVSAGAPPMREHGPGDPYYPDYPAERLAYFINVIDFDLDGDLDLLVPHTPQNTNLVPVSAEHVYTWAVRLFNGTGFEPPVEQPALITRLGSNLTIDVGGDGTPDLIAKALAGNGSIVFTQDATINDLLKTVTEGGTDGLDYVVTFNYKTLTDTDVYDPKLGSLGVPTEPRLSGAMPVVKSVDVSNGIGGTNQTRYKYEKGITDHQRGFLGFTKIKTTYVAEGLRTETDFHTTFPKAGHPIETRLYIFSSAQPFRKTVTDWQAPTTAGGALFVYPGTIEQWVYEPNSDYEETTYRKVNNTFDTVYGNLTQNTTETRDYLRLPGMANAHPRNKTITDLNYLGPQIASRWWVDILEDVTVTREKSSWDGFSGFVAGYDTDSKIVQNSYVYCNDNAPGGAAPENGDLAACLDRRLTDIVVEPVGVGPPEITHLDYGNHGNISTVNLWSTATGTAAIDLRQTDIGYDSNAIFAQTFTRRVAETAPDTYHTLDVTRTHDPASGRVTDYSDENGLVTALVYDGAGRLESVDSPGEPVRNYNYTNCAANPSPCVGTDGRYFLEVTQSGRPRTQAIRDALHRLARLSNELPSFASPQVFVNEGRVYDAVGRVTWVGIPQARDNTVGTQLTYDALGRLETVTDPAGALTTYTYAGATVTLTEDDAPSGFADEPSRTSTRVADSAGRIHQAIDALYHETRYAYDARGNLVASVDLVDEDTTHMIRQATFDPLGRMTSVVDLNSGTWTYQYDALGQLRMALDDAPASNHPSCDTAGPGQGHFYEYDGVGRLLRRHAACDAVAAEAEWHWDGPPGGTPAAPYLGQLHTVTGLAGGDHDGYTRQYHYDPDGWPAGHTTTLGEAAEHSFDVMLSYDSHQRPLRLTYPGGFQVEYVYDTGHLVGEQSPGGAVIYRNATGVTEHGQIFAEQFANGAFNAHRGFRPETGQPTLLCVASQATCTGDIQQQLAYDYDGFHRLRKRINHRDSIQEHLSYDALDRLGLSKLEVDNGSGWEFYSQIDYDYTDSGNLLKKDDFASLYHYAGSDIASPQQAGPHAVTSVDLIDNGGTVSYQYDHNGNLESAAGGPIDRTISYYASDLPHTVSNEVGGATHTAAFSYSPDGARFRQVATVGSTTTTTWYLDKLVEYVESPTVQVFRYYVGDYLVHIEDDDGIAPAVDNCARFPNPDQRNSNEGDEPGEDHIGNICDPDLNNDNTVNFADLQVLKSVFFTTPGHPNWNPDADLNGDDVVNFIDIQILQNYFYMAPGPGVTSADYYLMSDHLGSVDTVLNSSTGPELFGYAPFGGRRPGDWRSGDPPPADATTRGFTGHEQLDKLGLIHMNGRAYDPALARFTGADPIQQSPYFSQGLNAYSYVLNNPLGYTDPSGYFVCPDCPPAGGLPDPATLPWPDPGSARGWQVSHSTTWFPAFSPGRWHMPWWYRAAIARANSPVTVSRTPGHINAFDSAILHSSVAFSIGPGSVYKLRQQILTGSQADIYKEIADDIEQLRYWLDEMSARAGFGGFYINRVGQEFVLVGVEDALRALSEGDTVGVIIAGTGMVFKPVRAGDKVSDLAKNVPKGLLGRSGRDVLGETRLRGLNQNRPLSELTDADIRKTFADSPLNLSNHAISRILDPRTRALGAQTPNDIARLLNKGVTSDAGEGLIRIQQGSLEAIVNPVTKTIVTIRPVR